MTAEMPDLPGRSALDAAVKVVHDHADRIFLWNYDRSRGQLVTLYNKAMGSQWNSVTDLDWSTEVDPFELVDPTTPLQQLARAVVLPCDAAVRAAAFGGFPV